MSAITLKDVVILLLATFATITTTRGNVIEGPSNVTYLPGLTQLPIELTCNVTGFPLWRINNVTYALNQLMQGDLPGHNISGSNVLINNPVNSTEYVCISSFSNQSISSDPAYTIIALDLSATRTVLSADTMSITLSWNEPVGDFDPITSYVIIGCTSSDNGTFSQCPSFRENFSTFPSSVTQTTFNVSTMSDYNFDIIAVNLNGQSMPSSIVAVFMPSQPQQVPQMISGSPVIPASIRLTWSMPDVFNTAIEAPITGYQITFFIEGRTPARAIEEEPIIVQVGLQTSHDQTNLRPNTNYTIDIAAVNLIGIGPRSTNFQIISGEAMSGPPSSLTISNVGVEADTFTVTWGTPFQPNGVITGYEVQYRMSSDLVFMSVNTTGTSINLTSLIIGVEYTIRVRTINAAGPGNFTNPQTVLNTLIVRFSEITRTNQRPLDGENSVFTCNLLGGSNNISIDNEWSITLRNGTTLRISSNTSDLILLPPHNSSLIIVRHDRATFDRATVTCMGGRNFSGINAQLFIDSLTCDAENGRCEEECVDVSEDSISCRCPINETLVDGRICLSQLLYFTLYNEVYENATTFIHHPLYHPGSFELSCNSGAGFNSNTRWTFSPFDSNLEVIINQNQTVTVDITIDGMAAPVVFRSAQPSPTIVTLLVDQVIAGNFVCQSDNLSLHLTVETGGEPVLELLPPLPVRVYGMSSFNITINGFDVNRFGRTIRHTPSLSTFVIMYRSASLSRRVVIDIIINNAISVRAPPEFFSTYNPNQNTSYFEITFLAPSGSNASVSFSLEYFDIHGVILPSNRSFFTIGESLVLQCNTTPPDLPVTWERSTSTTNGFISLANDSRATFRPTNSKTFATLASVTLDDTGEYECVGTAPQLNNAERDIFIIPDSLTLVVLLPNGSFISLNDRGAYAVTANTPVSFSCVGVLNDSNIELFHSEIDISSLDIFLDNDIPQDESPTSEILFRSQPPYGPTVVDFSTVVDGNLTCRSNTSGREQSVYIGAASRFGWLVVPLIQQALQVLVGDNAEFSYLIALVDSSNVTSRISVAYRGPTNDFIENLELQDQGEDVYTFSIPSVSLAMDGAAFVLQFEEIDISGSEVSLRVLEQPINIFSGITSALIPNGNIVNNFDSLRVSFPTEDGPDISPELILDGTSKRQTVFGPLLGALIIICETLPGYENPFWEISDNNRIVNPVDNQTITNATGNQIATLAVLSTLHAAGLIINIPPNEEFPDELAGTYTCKVPDSDRSTSAILTNTDPYIVAINSSAVEVDFFDSLTLTFRAAYDSDGTANSLQTIILEQTNSNGVIANDPYSVPSGTNNPQIFSITFLTVGGNMAGTYVASTFIQGSNATAQVTVDVNIILPELSNTQNVTILSSQSTVLECVPSNRDLSIRWVLHQADGSRVPITFDDISVKRNIQLLPNIEIRFPYHNITIISADVSVHSGVYVCSINSPHGDTTIISRSIEVDVLPACHGPTLSRGLLWPVTAVNDTAMLQCSEINPSTFRVGPNATRRCLESVDVNMGQWADVDITNCTTRSSQSLVVYSTYLLTEIDEDITQSIMEIENEFQEQFTNDSTTDSSISVSLSLHSGQPFRDNLQIIPAVFIIEVLPIAANSLTPEIVTRSIVSNYNSHSFEEFSSTVEPPELAEITPNDICSCESVSLTSNEDSEIRSVRVDSCIGIAGPCLCDGSSCTCNSPFYAGNGMLCAQDSDQDNTPDIQLECTDSTCQMDVCPLIYNPRQNPVACEPLEVGCPMETDADFQIMWPAALPSTTANNTCRGGTGRAFRFCNSEGNWESPVVTNCLSFEYAAIMQQAMILTAESVNSVITNLATITAPDTTENRSILPLDIQAVTFVLGASLDIAEMNPDLLQQEDFVNNLTDIYSNLLDENNEPGYAQADRIQSQIVLESSERLAILLAKNLGMNETSEPLIRDNIVISVEQRNASDNNDVIFPSQELLDRAENNFASKTSASIRLPASLIRSRAINGSAPVANIIYRNLDRFLPTNLDNLGTGPRPVSIVISSQVTNVASVVPDGDFVTLNFQYSTDNLTNPSDVRCAFWNFSLIQDSGSGGWDNTNVTTNRNNNTYIECSSTHLTSFAVLVDVSGQSTRSEAESVALSIVSYIGCGISMFCLLIAIILLVLYRNTLLKGIHNFIHLNLAIALFLALLVFVSGIEPATENRNACKVIAALLHYFFTTVFTWMLCEGIMLYFLLVKVFNTGLGQRKLFYFSLGWGIPVPIVAIAAGIAHTHYGTIDYCWISTSEGAIWAFVAPMLAIIIANVFFMFMALRALYQSKKGTMTVEKASNAVVVKAILKASVILLPLLGITWVFGLLAVNENLTVFAWIFTILNSLQGMFILFFHVLKNDKIWTKIKSFIGLSTDRKSLTSTANGSSTGYTGAKKKSSAIPSSLQNDSIHLHSVTDKPSFAHVNNSSIMESNQFGNNSYKPATTIPEEETDANKNASIFIENDGITDSIATVEATDYASEPMDVGPQISSLPDTVTIEVDTSDPSSSDFRITTSHGDLTAPSLYNTS